MKSNIIKYIFILFVIFIIIFAAYKMYSNKDSNTKNIQKSQIESKDEILTNLRIGIANFDNINPIISQNRDVINLSTIIYEPLLSLTEDYKIEERLAKEISKINEKTYIIKLKENLKWENGTEITGRDVDFTIKKLKEVKCVYSDNIKNIKSVELIDSLTIKLNLKEEESFFEHNLIFPIISNDQFLNEDLNNSKQVPMSSGMYKVTEENQNSMNLVINNNWYKSETILRKINDIKIIYYSTMGDVYNSFKIGNIDMICTSNININDYIGTIGFATKNYKGRELDFISMNCNNTILSNKEVRQAINYAIDKNKIISSVYSSQYYVSSFPIDYGNYLYNKQSISSYNKNKAKKVLQDAGWGYASGRWQKNYDNTTNVIRLTMVVDDSNKQRVEVAKLIKEQLEEIGILISLNQVSNRKYKSYLESKDYDMILTGVYNGYSPDLSYFLGKDNIANYENEEINNILNDLKNISDEETIKQKYNRIIEIYEEELPIICLYRNKLKVIYSMKLTGDFNPTNYTAYYNIENWYRQ